MEETCLVAIISDPIFPCDHFSSFTKLVRVTAWMYRFVHNCQAHRKHLVQNTGPLIMEELEQAENYWLCVTQLSSFNTEIVTLQKSKCLPRSSNSVIRVPSWMTRIFYVWVVMSKIHS